MDALRRSFLLGGGNMRYSWPWAEDRDPVRAPPNLCTYLFVDHFAPLKPDVMCIQEVFEHHVPEMQRRLGLEHAFFSPMHHMDELPCIKRNRLGTLTLSRYPFAERRQVWYGDFDAAMPDNWELMDCGGLPMSSVHQEVIVDFGGFTATVGNTHFIWAPKFSYPPYQQAALTRLIATIGPTGDRVWVTDSNMRRGDEGWARLTGYWHDNIPPEVTTTFDPEISVAGQNGVEAVLDGIFSKGYTVSDIMLHTGFSDHQGYSAHVTVG